MEEYERDCQIDKDNLDVEWEKQPSLYMKWAARYAQATAERMRIEEGLRAVREAAKRGLEEIRATLDAEIRVDPGSFGLDPDKKPTEAAISGAVVTAPAYVDVYKDGIEGIETVVKKLAEAVESEQILYGATKAMDHKRAALDGETRLWLGGYYAEVKVPNEAREKAAEDIHRQMGKELKNNPRLQRRRIKE